MNNLAFVKALRYICTRLTAEDLAAFSTRTPPWEGEDEAYSPSRVRPRTTAGTRAQLLPPVMVPLSWTRSADPPISGTAFMPAAPEAVGDDCFSSSCLAGRLVAVEVEGAATSGSGEVALWVEDFAQEGTCWEQKGRQQRHAFQW